MIIEGEINLKEKTAKVLLYQNGEQMCFNLSDRYYLYQDSFKTDLPKSVLFVLQEIDEVTEPKKVFKYCQESSKFNERVIGLADSSSFCESLFELDLSLGVWYDKGSEEIFLSRDIFGLYALFYHYDSEGILIFSNDFPSIVERVQTRLNFDLSTIRNYYSLNLSNPYYGSGTFYSEIKSVLPGHFLKIVKGKISQSSYLNFRPEKYYSNCITLEDYGDIFKTYFRDSIKRHIEDSDPIGLHLSGGMDSSSICSMVNNIYPNRSKKTFFLETTPFYNEDKIFAYEIAKDIGSEHVIVSPPNRFLPQFANHIKQYGMPGVMVSGPIPGNTLREAAFQNECGFLLSGHGGDSIVGYGRKYLKDLYELNMWEELYSIYEGLSRKINYSILVKNYNELDFSDRARVSFNNFITKRVLQDKKIIKTIKKLYSIGKIDTAIYVIMYISKLILNKYSRILDRSDSWINEDAFMNVEDIHDAQLKIKDLVTKSGVYIGEIYTHWSVKINEELTGINNYHSVKQYHPFFDRNLYELCLAVPDKLKYNDGLSRGHLRMAMKDLWPESIQNRANKFVFNHFSINVGFSLNNEAEDLLTPNSVIWDYVNRKAYSQALRVITHARNKEASSVVISNANQLVIRTINLSIWLNNQK